MTPEPRHLRVARVVAAHLRAVLAVEGHAVTVASVTALEISLKVDDHPLRWRNSTDGYRRVDDWPRDIAAQHDAAEMSHIDQACRLVPTGHLHQSLPPEPIERATTSGVRP